MRRGSGTHNGAPTRQSSAANAGTHRLCAAALLLGLATFCARSSAQQSSPPELPPEPISASLTTLHVYANLIQLPTLVLDSSGDPIRERPGLNFLVSLDSGPAFPATHVRLEGEDPITLTFLLDASGDQAGLLRALPAAVARFASQGLLPQDRISIYAVDCTVARITTELTPSALVLRSAVADVLAAPNLHGSKPGGHCANQRKLWDSLDFIVRQMKGAPGRRVILAITNGQDSTSKRTWNQVRTSAQLAGVAIFGLAQNLSAVPGQRSLTFEAPPSENPFNSLCELSGGKVLSADPATLDLRLRTFVRLLRARFIVQFHRPDSLSAGTHDIAITVARQNYFIRPSGISVPIADPTQLASPNTLTADPTNAPEPGTRQPLQAPVPGPAPVPDPTSGKSQTGTESG